MKKNYIIPLVETAEVAPLMPMALSLTKSDNSDYEVDDEEDVLSKKSQRDDAHRDDYTDNGWADGLW